MALVPETLPSQLTTFVDTFNRANTAPGTGLGRMPGGPAWQIVSGSWFVNGGQPQTLTDRAANPLAVVYTGLDDVEVSAIVGGGDALYVRVLDAQNWVRARVAQNTSTPYVTWTIYLEVGRVAGVEVLASLDVPYVSRLRLTAISNALTIYLDDQAPASLAALSNAHRGALHHGIGRGGSPVASHALDTVYVNTRNSAPYAPTINAPRGGATVVTTQAQRLTWTHRDPDVGDTQSRYELRLRPTGAGAAAAWTTWDEPSTLQYRELAPGTLAGGDYEWAVRTYDSRGRVSPWSASAFFTATGTPGAATLVSPASGAVVGQSGSSVVWSAPQQDAYELARFAERATGQEPDLGVVYETTGIVESATARSDMLRFLVNNRPEWIGVRVRVNGTWSSWAVARVTVAWFAPDAPGIWVAPNVRTGCLEVTLNHPRPRAGYPAAASIDVQRRVLDRTGNASPTLTVAQGLAPGGFVDYDVRSGADYDYRVLVRGTNGATVLSAWASEYVAPTPKPPAGAGFSGGFTAGLGAVTRKGGFRGGFSAPLGPKQSSN